MPDHTSTTHRWKAGDPLIVGLPGTPREERVVLEAWRLAEPLCVEEGLELVFIEYRREAGGRVLRLYVDRQSGVSLEDCVAVSRQLGDLLDVHLEDLGPYRFEVSSPGSDRPLGKRSDFERFKGEEIRIRTLEAIDGQRNFKGILEGLVKDRVRIRTGEGALEIPLKEISKARLVNYNGEGRCL
ncbi:MAG: ribosome maturation factor RimP [Desulfobacterales bacterium]